MKHKLNSLVLLTLLAVGVALLLSGCIRFSGGVEFEAVPRSGESPLVVTFTPLVEGSIRSWLWDFGDGTTSSERNPSHAYINEGTYSVTLTVEPWWGESASTTKPDYITATGNDMVVAPIFITFVNETGNPDPPTVFVFAKNKIPTFDVLRDAVAWHVMPNVGQGSTSAFIYPLIGAVQAMWGDCNLTTAFRAHTGIRYTVQEDDTGIVLVPTGNASQTTAVEVVSSVNVQGGIKAQLLRDGKVLLQKNIVAYGQKATFIVEPKLYWGIAEEIQEGQLLSSAVLETDTFFELDLEGVSQATVTLTWDSETGYQFGVESE